MSEEALMDGALRQAIAELARDDAFARAVVELSSDDRALLAGRLRALLVEDKGDKTFPGRRAPDRPVTVRCGDRGCSGLVAYAVGGVVGFVSLERSAGCGSTNEMMIVERSVVLGEGVESATPAYCPQCWLRYDVDFLLQEVRVAQLLGRSRRVIAGSATAKGN